MVAFFCDIGAFGYVTFCDFERQQGDVYVVATKVLFLPGEMNFKLRSALSIKWHMARMLMSILRWRWLSPRNIA